MGQKNKNLPNLGIVAGQGLLPLELAKIYQQHGGRVYISCLETETNESLFIGYDHQSFKIGSVGLVINFFKEHQVKNIVFAGSIKRPELKSIKVDLIGAKLLARIIKQKFLGDDKVLTIVANFFEEYDFKVISAQEILAKTDISTITKPSKQDLVDIELGIKIIKTMSCLDIGQAVVVEDGYILGIEAAEGTDNLIKRCASLRKKLSGNVLIKMMKLDQDQRMDIPTIGPDTILQLAKYKYNGIAIQGNGVIMVNSENAIKLANKHKIFIVSL